MDIGVPGESKISLDIYGENFVLQGIKLKILSLNAECI